MENEFYPISLNKNELLQEIIFSEDALIVQDLDGVCIPLVKDPLDRWIETKYLDAANNMEGRFFVLTNGEHGGKRGVNRLVETSLGSKEKAIKDGLYLPGLAAGGVQYQDKFGKITHPGVLNSELSYLEKIPGRMYELLAQKLEMTFSDIDNQTIKEWTNKSIIDTQVSPTINLNYIFSNLNGNIKMKIIMQQIVEQIMQELLLEAKKIGLENSFFLHKAPNLGIVNNQEVLKIATEKDTGTTDIQFMIRGSIKEAGLLVLLNHHVKRRHGFYPLGRDFNVRNCPQTHNQLLDLITSKISQEFMPTIIGVGDTVTSSRDNKNSTYLRGGSDRGFLYLVQSLGEIYKTKNRVVLVDSSSGEVDRPNFKSSLYNGITDPEDPLKFNILFHDGPSSYINWFSKLSDSWKQKY